MGTLLSKSSISHLQCVKNAVVLPLSTLLVSNNCCIISFMIRKILSDDAQNKKENSSDVEMDTSSGKNNLLSSNSDGSTRLQQATRGPFKVKS